MEVTASDVVLATDPESVQLAGPQERVAVICLEVRSAASSGLITLSYLLEPNFVRLIQQA